MKIKNKKHKSSKETPKSSKQNKNQKVPIKNENTKKLEHYPKKLQIFLDEKY